ncbi:FecR family protein [Marinicella litoralis]|uniref:FecR family protein n=1 Tax=Marinicella litoralis TaxID=644220 RepID=A0A4R6XDN2_9GAMM|nr:FecR family protein [Marinicella litoralis]TDR17425.1 FecR family protein [Marinicella litoralis]
MSDINKQDIEKILDQAGPRIKPDQSIRDEVYQEVHALWQQTHKPPFYQAHAMKIAASLFLFISLFSFTLLYQGNQPVYNIAASIEIQGQIQISQNNSDWKNLDNDKTISPGDYLKTQRNNRLMVNLFNGNQFRVDENTHLKVEANNHLTLISGRVYVNSDSTAGHHKLTIDTPLATVNHIGTQYSVEFNSDQLNVGVREGLVLVASDHIPQAELTQGRVLNLNDKGEAEYSEVMTYDPIWQWTQKISGGFAIQDQTLTAYLSWVSEETGYPIKWQSDQVRNKAASIKLSGSINGILPVDSLEVILPTTRFKYSIDDNQIYIHNEHG